jgi:DNA-binding response OmpR family regulator
MAMDSLKILLVEDDRTLAEITEFRLELLGYDVDVVESAAATHAWLGERLPDVVILDLALCGSEGFDLLNKLSNDERTNPVPVLVFSTSGDLDCVQRAYGAGADEYLVTPYDPANLEEKIEKLTAQKSRLAV